MVESEGLTDWRASDGRQTGRILGAFLQFFDGRFGAFCLNSFSANNLIFDALNVSQKEEQRWEEWLLFKSTFIGLAHHLVK
jgi:hypothetical protein